MKTFSRFVTEAKEIHDREGLGSGTGTTHRGGSKIGAERKLTAPERRRTKAIGGGKTAPLKNINNVKMQVNKDLRVHLLKENNNQLVKEGLLGYPQENNNVRQRKNVEQQNLVERVRKT